MASKLFGTVSILVLLVGCADLSGGEVGALPTEPVGVNNVRPPAGPPPAYAETSGLHTPLSKPLPHNGFVVEIPDGGNVRVSLDEVRDELQHDVTLEVWLWFADSTDQEVLTAGGLRLTVENGVLAGEMLGVRLNGSPVIRNEWTHVALMVARNQVQLFINGIPQDREFLPLERVQFTGELVLGQSDAGQRAFRGRADNLRLVSRALYRDGSFQPSTHLVPVDYTVFGFTFDTELPGEVIPCAVGQSLDAVLGGGAGLMPGYI